MPPLIRAGVFGDMKATELRKKEVINIADGKNLGLIHDIEIDVEKGSITAIIVPGGGRFFSFFGRTEDLVITWDRVVKIGIDVILVELKSFVDPQKQPY